MVRQLPSRGSRIGAIARSLWWGGLILVHVPVLLSIGRSVLDRPATAEVLTWSVLCLTVFLFVLKLLDVRFLRFRTRRTSVVAFALACALVHHEVVASDAGQAVVKHTPALLATGLLVEGLRRAHLKLRGAGRLMAAAGRRDLLSARVHNLVVQTLRVPQPAFVWHLGAPRAPPC